MEDWDDTILLAIIIIACGVMVYVAGHCNGC